MDKDASRRDPGPANGREVEDAIIIEFKVRTPKQESDLEATVQAALRQIEEKKYAQELVDRGFPADHIRSYGFAFEGKTVIIGKG